MENSRALDRNLGTIADGLLLIWWGVRWSVLFALPNGTGLLGTGAILLGINALRAMTGIPTKSRTTMLGVLAFIIGGVLLVLEMVDVSLEIQVFEAILITIGSILVINGLKSDRYPVPRILAGISRE